MPPKKGPKIILTAEELANYRNEETRINIDLLNYWQILIGLRITNSTRRLDNYARDIEEERRRMQSTYGTLINNILGVNQNIEAVNNNDLLVDFFDNHINEFPKLRSLYNAILKKFQMNLYRIEFIFRNIANGVNLAYYQLNNNSMLRRLKSIVLGYFLRLPYNVVYGVQDSGGYYGEILEEYGIPISVFIENLGEKGPETQGGLFKYVNMSGIILSRYQIYTYVSEMSGQPHCIINCLNNFLGKEVVAENKKALMTILNNCDETNELPTDKLPLICKLFNIYIRVHKPKKIAGKYVEGRIKNNLYLIPKQKRKSEVSVMDVSIIEGHYINHEKVLGNIEMQGKISKRLTSTKLICDLYNKGNFSTEHDLVNHELYRKDELCDLDNMIREQTEFKKGDALKVANCRRRCFNMKKRTLIEKSSREIQVKYVDMLSQEISDDKLSKVRIKDYYCDVEAMFDNRTHIPYSIGKLGKDEGRVFLFHNNPENWDNPDFIKEFLNSFNTETLNILHFHNAKYDYSVLQKIGLGEIINQCDKEGTFYSVEFFYNNRYFIIYDTFKKVNRSLRDMANMFGLKEHKIEHTLHELHIIDAMKKDKLKYENIEYKDILESHIKYLANKDGVKKVNILPEDNYIIIDNRIVVSKKYLEVVESKYFENGYFKHKEYYDDYLEIDCVVLKNAMLKFDELMREIMGEHYSPYTMTISSIADLYACSNGAYAMSTQITGRFLNFCKKASRGGRVCTANNEIINTFITEGNIKIEDFDATSLYPSAIVMLKKIFGGIPVGLAERIVDKVFKTDQYGAYEVLIKSISKNRKIPVFSEKDGDVIVWTNAVVGKTYHMEYFGIKDAIEHQGADIEIIDGCYWTSYSPVLCDLVEDLFNKRKEYIRLQKEEEAKSNPDKDIINKYKGLSEMIKLSMNSIYGKNGLKKSPKNNRLMEKHDFDYYCKYNYNKVKPLIGPQLKTVDGQQIYQFSVYNDDPHYNRQHIAMCVLGCSKYIMNKFSMTAEDIGLDVYYTDTDSLHVCTENDKYYETLSNYGYSKDRNGAAILRDEYIKKYNEDPIGPNLGQFKSDFKMSNTLCTDIYSLGIIALGKKMYCHVLRGVNKQTGFIEYEVSCTMKGISERALNYHCNKYYCGNKLALFERIYNGEAIEIDMLGDKTLVSFDIKTGHIEHRETFPRIISVVNEDIKQLVLQDKDMSLKDLELKYQLPKQTIKKYLKEE